MAAIPECVRIPAEAYRYWPRENDAVRGSGTEAARLVFEGQKYLTEENEQIDQVEALMKRDSEVYAHLPSGWTRANTLRFVYAANWQPCEAVDLIHNYIQWHQTKADQLSAMQEAALPVLVPAMTGGRRTLPLRKRPSIPASHSLGPIEASGGPHYIVPSPGDNGLRHLSTRLRHRPHAASRSHRVLGVTPGSQ